MRRLHVELDIELEEDDPYYADYEIPGRVEDWIDSALNDRSDVRIWSITSFPVQYF